MGDERDRSDVTRCMVQEGSSMVRRGLAFLAVIASSLPAGKASAAPPITTTPDPRSAATDLAKEAYDRGTAAYEAKDFRLAAREFAHADELAPNAVALQAALDAAVQADDPLLGMDLADRATRDGGTTALHAAADAARLRFADRVGSIVVRCVSTSCAPTVDGAPILATTPHRVLAGGHDIAIAFDERASIRRSVVVHGKSVIEVVADRTASSGLAPTWFFVGIAGTAVLSGLTIASAIDTSRLHDRFGSSNCGAVSTAGCSDLGSRGASAQNRTNVLLGVSAAFGVGTVLTGLFFTRWGAELSIHIAERQATAMFRFQL